MNIYKFYNLKWVVNVHSVKLVKKEKSRSL